MSNKIIKKAAACGLSAVMAFGLVAVTEAPKTANVSAATKKVKKLSFKKKGYVISVPGHWMNAKTRLKFSPKSAKTYKLKYKTSNKKIATISKNGIIRAKKKGTVTITAIAKNNKKAKATTKVTVGKVVKTLKFKEGTKKTVTAGKKFTLHPTYSPKKASTKAVTFKSSNKKVATVTSKGKVTAKKAGKVTITATCKDAKGKKAKFTVTVKAIKEKELPELDDEFAAEVSEFETLEDYKADIKEKIRDRKKEAANTERENKIVDAAVEAATMDIPEAMIEEQVQQMTDEFAQRLSYQGLSMEQYLMYSGMDAQKFADDLKPQAVKRIETRLVLEAIAKAEDITASEEDFKAELEKMAGMYQMETEQLEKIIQGAQKDQMMDDIAVQKAVDFLVGEAK